MSTKPTNSPTITRPYDNLDRLITMTGQTGGAYYSDDDAAYFRGIRATIDGRAASREALVGELKEALREALDDLNHHTNTDTPTMFKVRALLSRLDGAK